MGLIWATSGNPTSTTTTAHQNVSEAVPAPLLRTVWGVRYIVGETSTGTVFEISIFTGTNAIPSAVRHTTGSVTSNA
jgi:hypothetical protein